MLFGIPRQCSWSPVNTLELLCSSTLILEPFTGLQVSPKPELFRFGIYVLELRERHALP